VRNDMNDPTKTPAESVHAGDVATVVALFETLPDAERALDALVTDGYDRSRISMVSSNVAGEYDAYVEKTQPDYVVDADRTGAATMDRRDTDSMDAGEGAAVAGGIGAAVGGVGGVLMGLGLLAIPGVGPALAAGPLVSGLVGAGIGAAAGSITGALVNAGVPEERAGEYAEGVRRGGTLLVVETTKPAVARAEEIMLAHGSLDIEERVKTWRDAGWQGFDQRAEPFTPEGIEAERARHRVERYDKPTDRERR
jgi:uncharacterized membrane protein